MFRQFSRNNVFKVVVVTSGEMKRPIHSVVVVRDRDSRMQG